MSNLRPLTHDAVGAGRRVAIVASRFNGEIVDGLVSGALAALERQGLEPGAIEVVRVPGAWEIPQALGALARNGGWDALIALGAVIRGETSHFEFVAGECSRGASEVALRHGIPVAFGVLTCDSVDQARARSGDGEGNKGAEAALAALEMAGVMARIGG
jgi:6,7-dimethyl-8-ribityllumazine synthase